MFILYDKNSGKILSAIKNEKVAKACVGRLPKSFSLDLMETDQIEKLDPQKTYRFVDGKILMLPKPHMKIEYSGKNVIRPGQIVKLTVLCLDEFGNPDQPRLCPHFKFRQTRWSKKLEKSPRNDVEFVMPTLIRQTDHFVAICHPYERATLRVTNGQQGTA